MQRFSSTLSVLSTRLTLIIRRSCPCPLTAWPLTRARARARFGPWACALACCLLAGCSGASEASGGHGKPGQHGSKAAGKSDKPQGGRGSKGQQAESEGPAALRIGVVHLKPRTIQRHHEVAATLQALRRAEIRALSSGIITELLVEEGDEVDARQVLARLDQREISLQAGRDRVALRNANDEYERASKAARLGIIPSEELQLSKAALDAAEAAARLSRHLVEQRTIRAPFAGTITTRHADIGNLTTSSSTIYDLVDLSALELEVHVPELSAAHIEIADEVELGLVDGQSFKGRVARRAPVVDAFTGTVKFTIQTTKPPPAAVPGAFVRASILIEERRDAPSLPNEAIFEVNGAPAVFIVADGRARRRMVELGLVGAEFSEVISGLDQDSLVVRDGADMTVGTRVEPVLPKPKDSVAPDSEGHGSSATTP